MICFAYGIGRYECDARRNMVCPGPDNFEACPYYRPKAEVDEARMRALKRIATLDKPHQFAIAQTYYSGKMPWKEGRRHEYRTTAHKRAHRRKRRLQRKKMQGE